MTTGLIMLGVVCVLAAITGSGFKAFGVEVPAIGTLRRQALLAAVGVILMAVGIARLNQDPPAEGDAQAPELRPATLEERDAYWDVSSGLKAYDDRLFAGAMRDFERAANKGDAEGQYRYGMMLARGEGVLPDKAGGYAWVRKAAEQAYPQAQAALAQAYLTGDIGRADPAQARHWAALSALQGNALGQYNAGLLEQDVDKRKMLLRKSAEQGYAEAQLRLAFDITSRLVELKKQGRPLLAADWLEAQAWLVKAAMQGAASAQCGVAAVFQNFARTEASQASRTSQLHEAYKWLLICERNPQREGDMGWAQAALAEIERALPAREADQARQEAAAFRPVSGAVLRHGHFEAGAAAG